MITDPVVLKHRTLEQIAMTAMRAARVLMESGARARVVHECAIEIARGLGADPIAFRCGYASMSMTVGSGESTITRMVPVGALGVNHRLGDAIQRLTGMVAAGRLSVPETTAELDRLIRDTPRHMPWFTAVAVGMACAAFGRLLGIDWPAFLPVFAAGTVGQYGRHQLLKRKTNGFVVAALVAFLAATIGGVCARFAGSHTVNLAMMASILLLVPGVPATNAQTDIMDGFPTLGSARAVSVLMIMLFATTGVWLAEALLGIHP